MGVVEGYDARPAELPEEEYTQLRALAEERGLSIRETLSEATAL